MPSKRSTGCHSTVIRCPNCGEDYSITYKRCPFCNEKSTQRRSRSRSSSSDGAEGESTGRRSGRRVAGSRFGIGSWTPLRIAGTVVSLAVIGTAVWIVMTQIVPLVQRSDLEAQPSVSPSAVTQSVEPSAFDSQAPEVSQSPSVSQTPEASPTAEVPTAQTATGFTLSQNDVSLYSAGETFRLSTEFSPEGTDGTVTFTSDKPEVAAVDENGLVTAKSSGTATITADLPGASPQECIVRCNFEDSSNSNAAALSLNYTDFTFSSLGEPSVQMKVSGTSSTPVWSIGNTSVATISESGLVKPVGKGLTTITCKVDGQTLECIVRCSF